MGGKRIYKSYRRRNHLSSLWIHRYSKNLIWPNLKMLKLLSTFEICVFSTDFLFPVFLNFQSKLQWCFTFFHGHNLLELIHFNIHRICALHKLLFTPLNYLCFLPSACKHEFANSAQEMQGTPVWYSVFFFFLLPSL